VTEFRLREAFWTRFGIRLEELHLWPQAKIRDYLEIMTLEGKLAAEQDGGGSDPSRDADTERAFEMMSAAAAERREGMNG